MAVATTTLDWFGCSTYRLTLNDTVVFLDAYIDRIDGAAGSGAHAADIAAADWILVGHSHFDHLWGAEVIARNTGAKIVGSHETVRVMENQGVPLEQMIPVSGGERIQIGEDTYVSVFPGLHSSVWSHLEPPAVDEVCTGDLNVPYHERADRQAALMQWLSSGLSQNVSDHLSETNQQARGDGHTLIFLIESPDGSVLFQDTSGYWTGMMSGLHPDVAILAAVGRGNVDGEPMQGSLAEFVGQEAALLQPKRVILGHHDDWMPGFSSPIDVEPIRLEIERRSPQTELVELDYVDGYALFSEHQPKGAMS